MLNLQHALSLYVMNSFIRAAAERGSLPGHLPLGFYVCALHCNDDRVSHSDSSSFQQIYSCKSLVFKIF